jgi:hypothetical protein
MRLRLSILTLIFIAATFFFPRTGGGQENPCAFSGYLWGTGARASFEVYALSQETTVLFTWPGGGADFWVKATDKDKKEILIDQSLSKGDILTLKGSGIYYLEIYSKWGTGCWKATVGKNK